MFKNYDQKIDQLSIRIDWLEAKVRDLQNPYKFNVGDQVKCISKENNHARNIYFSEPISYNGFIVSMSFNNKYLSSPYGILVRVNSYAIFNTKSKTTHHVDDYYFDIELA
jgi:hypothetical protein